MLAHLEPQDPETAKNATSTKHRKTRDFLAAGGVGGWGGGPLSYGEERNAFGNATARGPLAGLRGCRPCRRPRKNGQVSKPNGHRYSSVLRTFTLSSFSYVDFYEIYLICLN